MVRSSCAGVISPHDLEIIRWCEDANEAWDYICSFYNCGDAKGARI